MRKLTDVRRDIVHTIRQVVDVVSKYAGGALPEPARGRVRGFILKLPQRWASKAGSGVVGAGGAGGIGGGGERESSMRLGERETVAAAAGTGTGALRQRPGGQRRAAQRERGVEGGRSGASSRAPSPAASRAVLVNGGSSGTGESGSGNVVPASAALVASQRILALATESLDMMRNVTGVVKESLDRADAYVLFPLFLSLFFFMLIHHIFRFPDGSAVCVPWEYSEAPKKAKQTPTRMAQRTTLSSSRPHSPYLLRRDI